MPRRIADPAVMRAVAHPLRLAILTEMWDADRPLRATDLAEILGEPANSVSYHIRKLRDAGYVLDAEGPAGIAVTMKGAPETQGASPPLLRSFLFTTPLHPLLYGKKERSRG